MLLTMYLPGVLVVTLFAAVFADAGDLHPQESTGSGTSQSTALPSKNEDKNDNHLFMSEICFFDKFPSATCRYRCYQMNEGAHCVGGGRCACKSKETEPQATPEESAQNINQKPETDKEQEMEKSKKPVEGQKTSEEGQESSFTIPMHTAVQEPEEDQQKQHVVFYVFDMSKVFGPQTNETEGTQTKVDEFQPASAGWDFKHFIAIVIVILLLLLITLEFITCYKKQNRINNMETIFKNVAVPNKA